MNSKYLVRPSDYHVWEIDESNGCYRSYINMDVLRCDGTRPNAQKHFTYDILTKGYGFFPIDESEIEIYVKKNDEYHKFASWQNRSDGHGGIKEGTYEEYLEVRK